MNSTSAPDPLAVQRRAIRTGIYAALAGTIDIHIHGHPDFCDRLLDDADVAALAKEAGMRAIMLKSHAGPTADRAYIAQKSVGGPYAAGGLDVFGLICLNPPVGGFNPEAVRLAISSGVKAVWMPSMWAENHAAYVRRVGAGMGYESIGMRFPAEGLSVLQDARTLKPEVLQILDMVAAADLMLATGHLSLPEAHLLVEQAQARGITKLVVHTVNYHVMKFPLPDLLDMVARGAALEFGFSSLPNGIWDPVDPARATSVADAAAIMRAAGPANCLVTSDCGQFSTPMPIEAMRLWIEHLKFSRFTPDEINAMTKHVPARLLGL